MSSHKSRRVASGLYMINSRIRMVCGQVFYFLVRFSTIKVCINALLNRFYFY